MQIPLILLTLSIEVANSFGFSPGLMLAIAEVESGFNLYALGDMDAQGVPHSFGPWQLHDRGVGSLRSPDFNLDLKKGAYLVGVHLELLIEHFQGDYNKVISAWNQGVAGVESRGWEYNKDYVNNVLACWQKYRCLDQVCPWPEE